ncbi:hypothetical protein BDM02DRAFT_929930 [Thelephora ganbajun]|uniref:Uncharacterized protein n=1 Tax=Thelephora ganbajun TaxID=370292 RepID=A0ACB6Z4A4_THEGA|nr:hypothetical protein BDM02DRAFT_929930 [Thelephora ganbajun]
MFQYADAGSSVSCRLNFLGYPPRSSQITTADHKKTRNPRTRKKLALEVARRIRRYVKEFKLHGSRRSGMTRSTSTILSGIIPRTPSPRSCRFFVCFHPAKITKFCSYFVVIPSSPCSNSVPNVKKMPSAPKALPPLTWNGPIICGFCGGFHVLFRYPGFRTYPRLISTNELTRHEHFPLIVPLFSHFLPLGTIVFS